MLFRKQIVPACRHCRYSAMLDANQMLCVKKGVVSMYFGCKKFRYDPCKRIPPRPKAPDFDKFRDEDFAL